MKARDVLIKWTGSKRLQSPEIIKHFPSNIQTYYEPFLGGGSMLYALLNSSIQVEHIECSDINPDLIAIWQMVKEAPREIISYYRENWQKVDRQLYDQIREEHNAQPDPRRFFFVLRTCRNGLVRYNKKGKFNSAFHYGRKGTNPDVIEDTMMDWHHQIQNVKFSVRDYRTITSKPGDLLYLDPPYARPDDFPMYHFNHFNFEEFWAWLGNQLGGYLISLNGFKNEEDCRVAVPPELFDEHVLIANGLNTYHQLTHSRVVALDSLYIRMR
jgi:DNA adenine methylase